MHMRYANIETLDSAATYVATAASCQEKLAGFLRPDGIQALARRRSR